MYSYSEEWVYYSCSGFIIEEIRNIFVLLEMPVQQYSYDLPYD